ncbi:MAG: PAS domain S-box protein, partial [Methanomassiliicoccales archaeon]
LGFALYRFKLEEAKKAVEETLMRSERRYRHFFERANDGFAILQEGIVKYANNRLLSMGGYQEKDVIGKHFSEFIADEDKMRTLEYYRKRVAGENVPSIYEVKLKKKDGNLIWAELNAAVAENEAGLATYVIIRDITEKVRMRELLEESEWKYRMLFETSGTAMLIIEEDMTVSLVNGEFTRLTGYSREEIEGKMKTYQLVAEKEVERITEYHRRRREGRSDVPRSYELELKRKDGSIRMVKITIDVIPGTKRSVASLVDITEERQLKEILKKEKELYEMLLDSVDTMIWTANDPETYGEIVNRARMEFLGLSRERIANRKIYEFLPKPEAEVGVKGNRIVFEEKRKYRDFEWVTNAKGEKRLMLVTKIPKFGKNGNVEFAACTAEDVTELKKVQDALALANKKLHLLGSVTRHDIMNQLTVISGSLQLLSDAIQDEKQRRFLSMALRAASNIERHLDFSRDYEKMGANPPQWINLSKIISKALATIDRSRVNVNVQIDEHIEIFADPLIEKVFVNLLDNAVRHGGIKLRNIIIMQKERDDSITVICEDDGQGIEESRKADLFEGRYGRGLYLIKEILSITGMTIQECGRPGEGARFEITIPRDSFRTPGK